MKNKIYFRTIFFVFLCIVLLGLSGISCVKKIDKDVHDISGAIELCGEGFSGAEVTLYSREHGTISTVSGENGIYRFESLWDNTVYSISVNMPGYTFFPETHLINLNGSDAISQDFITNLSWSKTLNESEKCRIYCAAQTIDCGYILSGYKDTSMTTAAEQIDMWVCKLDLYGNIQWEKIWATGGLDIGYSVIELSDGGYMVAGENGAVNSGDIWVIRFDAETSDGETYTITEDWNRTYGDTREDIGRVLFEEDSGDIILGGYTVSASPGQSDLFIMRLDAENGDIEGDDGDSNIYELPGALTYGYSTWDEMRSLQYVSDVGNEGFVLGGYRDRNSGSAGLILKTDINFTDQWYKEYSAGETSGAAYENPYNSFNYIAKTSDNGFIAAGETRLTKEGYSDMWIIKLDSSGDPEWEVVFDRGLDDSAAYVYQKQDGTYYIAGYAYSSDTGGRDFWSVELDASGSLIDEEWHNGSESGDDSIVLTLPVMDGGYILAGQSETGESSYYPWLIKFNAKGE